MINSLQCGEGERSKKKIKGSVVLMKKNVLDFNDSQAWVRDRIHEFLGRPVSLQLISAVNGDPGQFFFPWGSEYCSFYYPKDEMIQSDSELQSWWAELRDEGHGDKKDEPWWPKMQAVAELTETCTIIIWIASALHAAVNFGQYPYAGYLPNRPTISRRFMLEQNPETAFRRTITSQLQTLLGISLIEILSSILLMRSILGRETLLSGLQMLHH
ncbi:hypothetical protein NE237_014327 [Protea cynaroides]|uniref:Lipoxygenase domain-containing protein n=1 Tax=Protea cynaroides TaxID=273540 RepID=A0A9Q0KC37_9MAGN|nr:hypothetical protein NE237_014327 [Protea cynaroides]